MGGTITTTQTYNKGDQDFTAQLDRDPRDQPGRHLRARLLHRRRQHRRPGPQARASTRRCSAATAGTAASSCKIGGKAIEGCYYSNHYARRTTRRRRSRIHQEVQRRTTATRRPTPWPRLGYDAAKLLVRRHQTRRHDRRRRRCAKAIAETKDFDGVTGTITFDATATP